MRTLLCAACLFSLALFGCGSSETPAPEAAKPAAQPAAPAPEEPKPAATTSPFSKLVLTDDPAGAEPKATLPTTAPKIIIKFTLNAKKGDKFGAALFVDKTEDPKLEGKAKEDTKEMPGDGEGEGDFGFIKPDSDWPKGEYHVELSLNGEVKETVKFKVE